MGTMLQAANLTADDFGGDELEGCNEHLVLTRPDVIQGIHAAYFRAGADIVETNTFGATPLVLAEYGLQDKARDINRESVRLARSAANEVSAETGRTLFVAGSLGPTTKALTVTGGTTFDELRENYREQTLGLLDGMPDLLMVETTQDTLNMKAAMLGIEEAFEEANVRLAIVLSATIEPMGTMLAGQSIEAWATSMEHVQPFAVGMNCATGPEFMTDHLRTLAQQSTAFVSVYPNAGLPDENGDYPETPESLATKLERFVASGWVNLVGGCCGTTPDHIAAIRAMVDQHAPRRPPVETEPAVSGIERVVIDQEIRPILVGERTNVIGSLKFKRLVESGAWENASEIGRAQVKRGAQVVDVCLSHTDRDEIPDVDAFYPQVTKKVKAPLMIDSTDHHAIEAALRHSQGKAIINSINLEDGEERFAEVAPLLRKYGGAVVVGCIDEDPDQGMAVTTERKLAVAKRSYDLLTGEYGIPARDIIFDPLVFPCGTGDEAYVGSAGETVEGTRAITHAFPECSTILGISNVSFGLPEAGREVLNSVFLHDCVEAGLTFAIVNTQGIERYPDVPEPERALCRALLYDEGDDPLTPFVEHFRGQKAKKARSEKPTGPVDERLARYVVEGTKEWLIADLDEVLKAGTSPLDIINGPLMKGMAEVGVLFGNNELIVAEVLQSAEVMKAAVNHLEPLMESGTSSTKGTVLLATVKGDVHDIGKNLVDIILSNNGYNVVDLGIKTPPEKLVQAAREHNPDIIGLSGLLVKSAQQMVITAEDLRQAGIHVPMVVGGAALSSKFTATRIAPQYQGPVAYARDAMGGLAIMDQIMGDVDAFTASNAASQALVSTAGVKTVDSGPMVHEPLAPAPLRSVANHRVHEVRDRAADLFDWINPKMLYGKHMGLRGDLESLLASGDSKAVQMKQLWADLLELAETEQLMEPRGIWRFFPAASDGTDVLVFDPDAPETVLETFHFERQTKTPGRCLSDYLPDVKEGRDTVAIFCVTAGQGVRGAAQKMKEDGEYVRSHGLQSLALETAEAFAEKLHADIRAAWGIDDGDISRKDVFKGRYLGCRFSFGYPACPNLDDQRKLWNLIDPTRIGVELTEECMMDPEASVSAIVFHHPDANYFNV